MNQEPVNLEKAEILIVDDIPANLNVLWQTLESARYNVIAAPSGEVALSIATRTPPDLILLDIMMPGIDGFETCRRLKANAATADIPVIFITAHNEMKQMVEGFKVGGDYYDFFPEGDDKLLVAIGDATGHGVGPSLMVSATKMALRTVDEPDLAKKICLLNRHLKAINHSHRLHMALTLVELGYDEKSGVVTVKAAGGGMPPLYILRAEGNVEEIMIQGMPLGAMKEATYQTTEFQLEKADLLISMSDGLPERMNNTGEQFGYSQIVSEIRKASMTSRRAKEILAQLVRKSEDWSNHTPQDDDLTLVVLKVI